MKITLLCVGKTAFPYLSEGISLYEKRLSFYTNFQRVEIPELKGASSLREEQVKEKEGELILKALRPGEDVLLLDAAGERFSSESFAGYVERKMMHGGKDLVFVIGGAYGFSRAVYERASGKVSLSEMTFSHQMVRLIFVEQLYRAFTILRGEPYHHK